MLCRRSKKCAERHMGREYMRGRTPNEHAGGEEKAKHFVAMLVGIEADVR